MTRAAMVYGAVLAAAMMAMPAWGAPVAGVTKQPDGVMVAFKPGVLRVQVWGDNVVRVTYGPGDTLPETRSFTVVGKPDGSAQWTLRETPETVAVETTRLRVKVDRATGAAGIYDLADKPLLKETAGGREVSTAPAEVDDMRVRQSFELPADEGIYGLGQHQAGAWNYRGQTVRLLQENMQVGIPVMLSSKGYMLLWDNPAVTVISAGAPKGAATSPAPVLAPATATAPGTGTAPATGRGPRPNLRGKAPMGAGEDVLRWSSEAGKAVDYYFCGGATADEALRGYRKLTGEAPLMPKWMLGFWQCKERYASQAELLDVAGKYRDAKLPIDGIIQDWHYWGDPAGWGSHQFDPARYPDPAALFKQLHDEHFHAMISVWSRFDIGSDNNKEMAAAGALYEQTHGSGNGTQRNQYYDAFNGKGRELYWKQLSTQLFAKGVDAWWMDASEAELGSSWGEFRSYQTAAGPGSEVYNAYPLMDTTAVYQGQRAQTSDKRVVILTRSAYAGQQRNSAITWSGDIQGTWQVLKNQVPAALNFSLSGIPYWSSDTGGFSNNRTTGNGDATNPQFQEFFARWFQFSAFCPMFRTHGSYGTRPVGREVYRFDDKTQGVLRRYLELRYRMMPYTYSVAWQVTSQGAAIMRPLVMDFANDPRAMAIGDQYLFGPAVMASPVTTQGATSREVYLPGKDVWYDFWTGKKEAGGKTVTAAAPVETMPLFVRSGSIVPLGPVVQYADEKPDAPWEVRVYRGADGAFTIYEDAGDGYDYEKGAYATIPLTWNEGTKTLTIGARKGSYPGMVKERKLRVMFVGEGHGAGVAETLRGDQEVTYTGAEVSVKGE